MLRGGPPVADQAFDRLAGFVGLDRRTKVLNAIAPEQHPSGLGLSSERRHGASKTRPILHLDHDGFNEFVRTPASLHTTTQRKQDAYLDRRNSSKKASSGLERAIKIGSPFMELSMSLIDLVQQHLGADEIQQISQQLGADPNATQTAVQAAVPMMVGGMASTANEPTGASTIQSLLGSHGGLLENIGGMLGSAGARGLLGSLGGVIGTPADSGGGLLGKILGHHENTVQQGVQQASGLNSDQTKKLLMILGPIVLAALARRHAQASEQGTNPSLTNVLQQDAQAAQAKAQTASPQVGGLLGKILSHVEAPRA